MTEAAPILIEKTDDNGSLAKGRTALTWRDVYPGKWRHQNGYIWSDSIPGGDTTPAMVRGWGYLTGGGHGALKMSDDDAIRIQGEVGSLIAAAPALLAIAQRILERGYVSESIEEERADHAALTAAIAQAQQVTHD